MTPDLEDLALTIADEKELTSLRSEYHELCSELRDYQKHTDRQLRELSREKKAIAHELWRSNNFDVARDSFEVLLDDGETIATMPWSYGQDKDLSDKAAQPLTRKDKRRAKTEQRRAARYLRIWRTQWEKSRAASVVRKTGALPPAVAGMCHA